MTLKHYAAVGTFASLALAFVHGGAVAQDVDPQDPIAVLMSADANEDGTVEWTEIVAMRTRNFERMDRNGDGTIDQDDRPGLPPFRGMFDDAFTNVQGYFDADGDERVTRDEMINGPSPMFTRADTDEDKVLTPDEIDALRASLAAE